MYTILNRVYYFITIVFLVVFTMWSYVLHTNICTQILSICVLSRRAFEVDLWLGNGGGGRVPRSQGGFKIGKGSFQTQNLSKHHILREIFRSAFRKPPNSPWPDTYIYYLLPYMYARHFVYVWSESSTEAMAMMAATLNFGFQQNDIFRCMVRILYRPYMVIYMRLRRQKCPISLF